MKKSIKMHCQVIADDTLSVEQGDCPEEVSVILRSSSGSDTVVLSRADVRKLRRWLRDLDRESRCNAIVAELKANPKLLAGVKARI